MADDDNITVITPTCPECKLGGQLVVPRAGYVRWKVGELIQLALPTLTPDQREQLMTGLHSACWDKMMGVDDEEED